MNGRATPSPSTGTTSSRGEDTSRDEDRAYLLDMIQQLAKLARTTGETEVEILLRAILDISRARGQRRTAG